MTRTWTEGVCSDGAAILCDGVPVPISELLTHLNRCEFIRSAALEEAARVADEIDRTYENHDLRWGVQRCAERIRALKDKQSDTRTPTEGESL